MYVIELADEAFYRVTKSLFVGSEEGEAITELDLTSAQYKHRGILIHVIDNSNGNDIEVKFYDPSTADGLSSEYVTITVLSAAGAQPYILPCRVAKIKVTNGPDALPVNKTKIQIGLLN